MLFVWALLGYCSCSPQGLFAVAGIFCGWRWGYSADAVLGHSADILRSGTAGMRRVRAGPLLMINGGHDIPC